MSNIMVVINVEEGETIDDLKELIRLGRKIKNLSEFNKTAPKPIQTDDPDFPGIMYAQTLLEWLTKP